MRLRSTNNNVETHDVYYLRFDSAGALELDNEYSGLAAASAHYIAFAELKQRTSLG